MSETCQENRLKKIRHNGGDEILYRVPCHLLPPDNPDAGFNEFIGAGTGKLDGKPGASIVFDFTDQGEPGTNDTESMTIFDSSDTPVLSFGPLNLTFGDQQGHRVGGPKVPPCLGSS